MKLMYIVKVIILFIIKIICLLISISTVVVSIINLRRLPDEEFSCKWNLRRMNLYEILSPATDLVLCAVISFSFGENIYNGSGIEIIMAAFVIIILTPILIINASGYYSRKKSYCTNNKRLTKEVLGVRREYYVRERECFKYVFATVMFKVMFIILETIWITEIWA